jgi:hypothetical protein
MTQAQADAEEADRVESSGEEESENTDESGDDLDNEENDGADPVSLMQLSA